MKKTVLAFSRVSPEMAERLQQDFNVIIPDPKKGDLNEQFNEALPHSHGMIGAGRTLGREQLESAKQLEVVSSISVGYDNYDVGYLTERGIMLTNTPDVLTESTADLGFSLIMSSARRVAELDAYTKAGKWKRSIEASHFGTDVYGKTLGIVGMGNIGAAVARRGRLGFNMPIPYAGPTAGRVGFRLSGGAAQRKDPAHDQYARTVTDEKERHSGKHRPRPDRRRTGANQGAAGRHHSRRRSGCLRKRAAVRIATVRTEQRGNAAPHRLGD
jgi:phosphoglycerate dehydrogenase-like enzyme